MKKFLCLLLIFVMALGCIPVFAAPASSTDLIGSLIDTDDSSPKTMLDWDSFVQDYFEAAQVNPETVTLGYYNTVTGEEHYFRGDVLTTAGSVNKVPLNMYYAEKVYNGDISWDTTINGVDYRNLQLHSIRNSSNDYANYLIDAIGSYADYRKAICPYIGLDAEAVDRSFLTVNQFSPEQMIYCLKLLYSEPERFPGVIDCMLQATPEEYFEQTVTDYDIAQKYGWYVEDNNNYINCIGIVETEEPILLAIFTRNCRVGKKILGDYCALMCEYTENNSAVRKAEEEEAARKEAAEEAARQAALEELARQEAEAEAARKAEEERAAQEALKAEETKYHADTTFRVLSCLLGCAVLAVVLGLLARFRKKPVDKSDKPNKAKITLSVVLGIVAALAIIATVAVSIFALNTKPIIMSESTDPSARAEEFLSLVLSDQGAEAEKMLLGSGKLGLDSKPQDNLGRMLYSALLESFSYEKAGECVKDSIDASQSFTVSYLDIPAITALQQEATNTRLAEYVEAAVRAEEVQAPDGSYLPEVAMRALEEVTEELLVNAEDYYVETSLVINMQYSDGEWMIIADEALFAILSGNTAY